MNNVQTKGTLNGACNRTACDHDRAIWFNPHTNAYYCAPCARKINAHLGTLAHCTPVLDAAQRAPAATP